MSNTAFVESQSTDPFVRELSRCAVRILNDQSLDRRQREALIHRLQARLKGHLAKQALVAAQKAAKASKKAVATRTQKGLVEADRRQVLSLRKEFKSDVPAQEVPAARLEIVVPVTVAANDGYFPNRSRSVLTLKRA